MMNKNKSHSHLRQTFDTPKVDTRARSGVKGNVVLSKITNTFSSGLAHIFTLVVALEVRRLSSSLLPYTHTGK